MIKKIYSLLFCTFAYCLAGEFCFSNDTVWEDAKSIHPVETYLKNLSNDSIYIDSLALIIDSVKFPKYGLSWSANMKNRLWYRFDNYPSIYIPSITEYNIKYERMYIPCRDSLLLFIFFIDKFLIYNNSHNSSRDSIVPIILGIVFFSKGYVDTLILNGDYDYYLTDPNNIIEKNKKTNIIAYVKNKKNTEYLYTCSGKKVFFNNNIYSLGNGLYFSYDYNRKYFIMNGCTIFAR